MFRGLTIINRAVVIATARGAPKELVCAQNAVSTMTELVDRADNELFKKVLDNLYYVLRHLRPDVTVLPYELRP